MAQLPLDFGFASSERKSVEPFVTCHIGKDGLNHGHSMAVDLFALLTVDSLFHPVGMLGFGLIFIEDKGDLSSLSVYSVGWAGALFSFVVEGKCFGAVELGNWLSGI